MSDYDAEIVSVVTEDDSIGISTTAFHKDVLKEQADKMGLSLSAACRYWISTGMKLHSELDPREGELSSPEPSSDAPLGRLIESEIPSGEENAEEMDEIIERLQKQVEDEFLDYVQQSEKIERDKWKVYK